MEVRSGCVACSADFAEGLTLRNSLTEFDVNGFCVSIKCLRSVAVVDNAIVAEAGVPVAIVTHANNNAALCCAEFLAV